MPRDGNPQVPTRDEIIANIRQQNSGHLIEQIIGLEADKVVLMNEVRVLQLRVRELEQQLSDFSDQSTVGKTETVEPA